MDYVFGYGSLISKESRERTGITGNAIPEMVQGIDREFCFRVEEEKTTVLGAIEDKNSFCNGVVFPVEDISKFDEREKGYRRVEVKPIEKFDGTVWAYVPNEVTRPSEEYPINQSYIDVVMSGCLDFGELFTKEFVLTTRWEKPWINDRNNPRYIRAIQNPDIEKIDEAIKVYLPLRS